MNSKAFTLLELIVVLIVMAALVAIALPQYTAFVERSRAAEAINTIGTIRAAEESYFIMRGAYVGCNLGEVSNVLGINIPEENWKYAVVGLGNNPPSGAGFWVTATRQNTLGCPPQYVGSVIMFYKEPVLGNRFEGTHPGAPKQ